MTSEVKIEAGSGLAGPGYLLGPVIEAENGLIMPFWGLEKLV